MLGIIIPTKNRSDFITNQLFYYAAVESPYTIYIGDSSDKTHLEKTLLVIEKLKKQIKVVHKHYPGTNAPAALKNLSGIVQEKYVAMAGDDDFLIPNSLEKCIEFLEGNQDYATVQGKAVLYTLDRAGAYGRIESFGGYNLGENEYKTPNQRLVYFLSNYWVPEFSVRRTENHIQACDRRDIINDSGFAEIVTSCVSMIQGKSRKLDCLYLIRQVHNQRDQGCKSALDWITNRNWQPAFQIFHDRVVEALMQYEDITRETASDIVKQAFWKYFAGGVCRKFQKQKAFQKRIIAFRERVKRIPGIKYLYINIRSKIPGSQNAFYLENLLKSSSPYHKDFMPVYNVITSTEKELELKVLNSR